MNVKKILEVLFGVFVAGLLIIVIIQPDFERPLFRFLFENTLWIIIALIGLGMLFLILRNEKMLIFSLLSAALLTFYLKGISNESLMYKSENKDYNTFKISQYSSEEFLGNHSEFLKFILSSKADVLSITELPPDLNNLLKEQLKNDYPNIVELNTIDFNSRIVFSKHKITSKDTFLLKGQPQLRIGFNIKDKNVNVLFPYILPFNIYQNVSESITQIEKLTDIVNDLKSEPLIIIGEFNQVYWTKEIREFLFKTKLNNARRFVYALTGRNPYNHIFYTTHINCTSFEDLYDKNSVRVGLYGNFEILSENQKFAYIRRP